MDSFVKRKFTKHVSYYQVGIFAVVFLIGLSVGYALWGNTSVFNIETVNAVRANDPNYPLINPLLTCNISENKEFAYYEPLERKIQTIIDQKDPNHHVTVSVYYRDLISGRWFGINEQQEYSPASLLKVPIMIAYLKEAETNPSILSKKIYYDGHSVVGNSVEYYKSPDVIQPGRYYTVDQLISSMIQHSDNAATVLLFNNIDNSFLVEVMTDIGLKLPNAQGAAAGTDDYMTVKSYSYLFRLLYNSTYLNRNMSEKALQLLSYADFTHGLVKGVPNGVQTAQKFGERTEINANGTPSARELHDCGIVYAENHPYLICVMTRSGNGETFDNLAAIISSISKVVYETTIK